MSLVSVHNFTAPLRHRIHLITIILVTVVFATLRLSGASFEVKNANDPRRGFAESAPASGDAVGLRQPGQRIDNSAAEEVLRAMRAQRAVTKRAETPLTIDQNSRGDLIEDVMRPAPPPVAQNKVETSDTSRDRADQGSGSLSDIEKQLGLK